jgi:pyridinium-3,5-biscarboxylic acid mononucleotide synthase
MKQLKDILDDLSHQKISVEQAEQLIKIENIENIDGKVQLDIFRHMRTGIPEVIFAESKPTAMLLQIINQMLEKNKFAIISRLKPSDVELIKSNYSDITKFVLNLNEMARVAYISEKDYQIKEKKGTVGIITAGTSDIPIAEESNLVLKSMGINTLTSYDVGIAGFHRIFPPLKEMIKKNVNVLIVIAGMEGTLPGVISALVDIPVIGVPASTGYGLGEKGKGALVTMLQSCSPGLAIVNIDNGFGAASMAALIINSIYKSGK